MNLGRLRVFREVAQAGTFAGAADALSFTPSAVSQQMARLEEEVGATLVERTTRGVHLTAAGRVLLARADAILAEVAGAQAELAAIAQMQTGVLRFGSFPTATQTIVAGALRRFRDTQPGVAVRLVDDEPHNLLVRLRERELAFAIVFSSGDRPPGMSYHGALLCAEEAIETEDLFTDPFVAVLPERHPLAAAPVVELEALRDEPLIGALPAPGMTELAVACRRLAFEPRLNGWYCADYLVMRALAAAGEGIALVPRLAAAPLVPGTVARPLGAGGPA
ncbi:MAG TPA: LysR family transcriptional regulator, partial [Capillimicrobium sp.]